MYLKKRLKEKLTKKQKFRIKRIVSNIKAIGAGYNLNKLAEIYKTDKFGNHTYTPLYKLHLAKFKFKKIKLFEIGAGGFKDPYGGGNSLRMWKKYFPFGRIFSIDIYDKTFIEESRIKIFKGSQFDNNFLKEVIQRTGELDIIIDDGCHINEQVISTFMFLFQHLKDGGIYVIEDTQASYWKDFGGDSEDLDNPKTTMNFFKGLIDGLNNKEFEKPGYKPSYFDQKIVSMHFYHNLIFIYKGENNEESNIVYNNQKAIFEKN